jgi:DNA-binding transcriptional regulator YdaS (Cro superfamily)
MEYVKALIDKAAKVCGSDQALADKLGIARPNISLMRAGKRQVSPATAAELADIAGEDARQAAIDAVIENAKGTRREGVLREILGKALAAGVAGMLVFFYSGESISATKKIARTIDSLYIVSNQG